MVFSDLFFLFVFIPLFVAAYLLMSVVDRRQTSSASATSVSYTFRNLSLVIFSLIFYAWGEPAYVLLMLFCVLLNYVFGRLIDKTEGKYRKVSIFFGLVCNILILGTFKYLGFLTDILADIGIFIDAPHLSLPIGISFYTFQSISYLVDVYRRESPVQRSFLGLLLYISMFPQLIAGPIVRYGTVAREIHDRHATASDFSDGIYRFLIGLGKKVILANQFSEIVGQFLGEGLAETSTAGAWIGIVAFTLQIYYDFSGYSDMAIGIGRCLGFHFNENFNHPYCCNSITDFWCRWHMSLGSFFRDYVYIPLGGNRSHQTFNILVVWFLTGMWHGASWNFITWGCYFGIIVLLEKFTILRWKWLPSPLLHLYSMILVVLGWGIFYFDDFNRMLSFFHTAFFQSGKLSGFADVSALTGHFWLWVVGLVFIMPVRKWSAELLGRLPVSPASVSFLLTASRTVVSLLLLAISVALLVGATNNAFLYTRF